jgi:hypothetical protein
MSQGAANAHRAWILPSGFTLSGEEQTISVDAAISNDLFFPNHVAIPLHILSVTAPDGKEVPIENGWSGKVRSAFDVTLNQQGTWKVASGGSLYFAMWEEEGDRKRVRGSLEKIKSEGLLDKPGVRLMKSTNKVETFVTLGAPTDLSLSGAGLEMEPVTHPNDIYVGETASFVFTLNGTPQKDLEVEIVKGHDRYRDSAEGTKLVTDDNGMVSVTLSEAGRYWMSSEYEGKAKIENRSIPHRLGYVVTFEALAQ